MQTKHLLIFLKYKDLILILPMFMLSFIFVIVHMGFLSGSRYVHVFYRLIIFVLSLFIKKGGFGSLIFAYPKPGHVFPTSYVVLSLCSVSSVAMRSDCSFCWYWWNWSPSLIKLFYNNNNKWVLKIL